MPIFGKSPPSPPAGARVPRRQRETLAVLRQLSQLGGGRGVMWSPSGPQIVQPGTTIRMGTAPGGGIAKTTGSDLSFGTITESQLVQTDPTTVTVAAMTSTFTAFNLSTSQDVPDGGTVVCMLLWGVWVVIWADCP